MIFFIKKKQCSKDGYTVITTILATGGPQTWESALFITIRNEIRFNFAHFPEIYTLLLRLLALIKTEIFDHIPTSYCHHSKTGRKNSRSVLSLTPPASFAQTFSSRILIKGSNFFWQPGRLFAHNCTLCGVRAQCVRVQSNYLLERMQAVLL